MSIINTLVSAGALFAAGSTPGTLFLDGSSNTDFSVETCTANSVVITGTDASALEPGHIIAYIGDSDSLCTSCSPLFRKVVSRDGDKFTTTFATFREVFSEDMYDVSLENIPVEPMLNCEHSQIAGAHRLLDDYNDYTILEYDYWGNLCDNIGDLNLYMTFIACVCPPLWPWLGAIVGGIELLDFLGICPGVSDETLRDNETWVNDTSVPGDRLLTIQEFPLHQGDLITTTFPETCSDWMAKDSNGRCLYVDCNVGADGDPSSCFSCKDSCSRWWNLATPESEAGFDFSEAHCIKDYCYSSIFDKKTCDDNFFKAMRTSCPALPGSAVQTTFPLPTSALSENCKLISIVFYLESKLLGRPSYSSSQFEQSEYQRASCGNHLDSNQL